MRIRNPGRLGNIETLSHQRVSDPKFKLIVEGNVTRDAGQTQNFFNTIFLQAVQDRVLKMIQSWAHAFSADPDLQVHVFGSEQ